MIIWIMYYQAVSYITMHEGSILSLINLSSTFNSCLILSKIDESSGKMCPVRNAHEKELSSLVKLILKTFLSNNQYVFVIPRKSSMSWRRSVLAYA